MTKLRFKPKDRRRSIKNAFQSLIRGKYKLCRSSSTETMLRNATMSPGNIRNLPSNAELRFQHPRFSDEYQRDISCYSHLSAETEAAQPLPSRAPVSQAALKCEEVHAAFKHLISRLRRMRWLDMYCEKVIDAHIRFEINSEYCIETSEESLKNKSEKVHLQCTRLDVLAETIGECNSICSS